MECGHVETAAVLAVLPPGQGEQLDRAQCISKGNKVALPQAAPQGFQLQNESGDLATAPSTGQKTGKKKLDEKKIPPRASIGCSGDLMEEMSHVSGV